MSNTMVFFVKKGEAKQIELRMNDQDMKPMDMADSQFSFAFDELDENKNTINTINSPVWKGSDTSDTVGLLCVPITADISSQFAIGEHHFRIKSNYGRNDGELTTIISEKIVVS